MSWADKWQDLLKRLGYEPHLRRGRSYARRGQVKALEVQMGQVTAQVEDRDTGICEIKILVTPLTDEQWNKVIDALSRQAIFVAQLLAGDMPTNIDELFQQTGVGLLPGGHYDIEIRCGQCDSSAQPCKHTAAVLYLLGQMVDDDPWLLFRLRGRDRQQVLQALRQLRSEGDAVPASVPSQQEPMDHPAIGSLGKSGESGMPLAAQVDSFWGDSRKLEALHHHISPPPIRLALLRRLGHPPFPTETMDTYDRLARIYQMITEEALALAYAPEPDED